MEAKLAQLTEQVSNLTSIISSLRPREGAPWKQKSRFSGYDDSDNEAAAEQGAEEEEATPMVTPLEEWATPRQEWLPKGEAPELGSPIEGEMF